MGTVWRMKENNFKVQAFMGEVMTSVYWGSGGFLLVKFLKISATINSEQYIQILKLKQRIQRVWPNRKMNQIFILLTGRFSTFQLPALWYPDGSTLSTTLCG
jgi:hypothetical protein